MTTHRRHRPVRAVTTSLVLAVLLLFACERPETPVAPDSTDFGAPALSAPQSSARDQEEGERLGRALAIVLGDPDAREVLSLVTTRSTHREGKVALARFLGAEIGADLRGALTDQLGIDPLLILDNLPPLELYLPVEAHRDTWLPGNDIEVAVAIHEADSVVAAYDYRGQRRELERAAAPPEPVVVLTKSETDFSLVSFPSTRGEAESMQPRRPASNAPARAPSNCSFGWVGDTISGLYMTCNDIYSSEDLHEPWIRGDPEIEVHFVHEIDELEAGLSYCAGEHSASANLKTESFDQNGTFWWGEARLLPLAATIGIGEQFLPAFYEDDDGGPCQPEGNPPELANNLDVANFDPWDFAYEQAAVVYAVIQLDAFDVEFIATAAYNLVSDFVGSIDEDDFIGILVKASDNGISGLGWGNYAILDAAEDVIGRTLIVDRNPSFDPPQPTVSISGPEAVLAGQGEGCEWWAEAAYGSPGYTYDWDILSGDATIFGSDNNPFVSIVIGNQDFDLYVEITDQESETADDEVFVDVSGSNPACDS